MFVYFQFFKALSHFHFTRLNKSFYLEILSRFESFNFKYFHFQFSKSILDLLGRQNALCDQNIVILSSDSYFYEFLFIARTLTPMKTLTTLQNVIDFSFTSHHQCHQMCPFYHKTISYLAL